jgi:hypothetical protein
MPFPVAPRVRYSVLRCCCGPTTAEISDELEWKNLKSLNPIEGQLDKVHCLSGV